MKTIVLGARFPLSDYLYEVYGDKWVVAARLTPKLRARGYTVAISPRRFAELEELHTRATAPVTICRGAHTIIELPHFAPLTERTGA